MFMPLNVSQMGRSIVSEHAGRCRSMQVDAGHLNHGTRPLLHLDGLNPSAEGARVRNGVLVHAGSWVFRERSDLSQSARLSIQFLGRVLYRRVNVASTAWCPELVDGRWREQGQGTLMLLSGENYANRYSAVHRAQRYSAMRSRFRRW